MLNAQRTTENTWRWIQIFLIFILLQILTNSSFAASDKELRARIHFIQNALDQAASHSKLWQNGWLNTMALNATLSTFCYFSCSHASQRFDAVIQVVLGANSTFKAYRSPLRTHEFAQELRAMPFANQSELIIKLARAEQMLALAATRERYERSFTSRSQSYFANLLASLLIAGNGRPRDAWQTFALMSVAIELKTRSMPKTMTAAEAAYQRGAFLSTHHVENKFVESRLSIGTRTGRDIQFNWRF